MCGSAGVNRGARPDDRQRDPDHGEGHIVLRRRRAPEGVVEHLEALERAHERLAGALAVGHVLD